MMKVFVLMFLSLLLSSAYSNSDNLSLTKLSARGYVGQGENVLIAGFTVEKSKRLLIQAHGPSLQEDGINNFLEEPFFEVYSGSELIDRGYFWDSLIDRNGWLPEYEKDMSLFRYFDKGHYTIVVRGLNGSEGIAVVAVYDIDNPDLPRVEPNISKSSLNRIEHTSTTIDEKTYVIGGKIYENEKDRFTSLLEIYDANTETWSTGADLPKGRSGHTSVVAANRIFVIGGYDYTYYAAFSFYNNEVKQVDVYDIAQDKWNTKTTTPNTAPMKALVFNNEIYLFGQKEQAGGGTGGNLILYNYKVHVYSVDKNQWRIIAELPFNSFSEVDFDVKIIDDEIYVFRQKGIYVENELQEIVIIYKYNVNSDSWIEQNTDVLR